MNASISGRVGGDEDEGAFARVARPLGAEATTGNLKVKIRERKKKEKKRRRKERGGRREESKKARKKKRTARKRREGRKERRVQEGPP